ncbi:Glycosyltransferase family 8 [Capnocytophaga canis]|uniref:Glycosyltransferase family 8 n=1 Tax=Capnocytophaga canis TaxID=1848903 RepID=A0A0B7HUP1_9FLAO|nr:glycosyltransferase family 8 protein [Capnocytophaga canis]CEN43421.1 Glycosyltransferase family 8 [Capnocytophaga canis]CEN44378.1 Glycosyltransferase family 8 [Capnocytophaga canis]
MAVALTSLLDNNKDILLGIFLLLTDNLSKDNEKKILDTVIYENNVQFETIIIDKRLFATLNTGVKHLSIAAFSRILIPNLIERDRVLYLDNDLVVLDSLKELFEIDFNDKYLLAIQEIGSSDFLNEEKKKLGVDIGAKYFNSGVMMINCSKWREDGLCKKIIDWSIVNTEKISFADQDGLNAVINGRWKPLPIRYNVQTALVLREKMTIEEEEAINKPCIVHYTGAYPNKPWFLANTNPFKKEYWKYLKKTPFANYKPSDYKGFVFHRLWRPFKEKILRLF